MSEKELDELWEKAKFVGSWQKEVEQYDSSSTLAAQITKLKASLLEVEKCC